MSAALIQFSHVRFFISPDAVIHLDHPRYAVAGIAVCGVLQIAGDGILFPPFWAAARVFSINEGAYCAETMRAALEAMPLGPDRSGLLVGLRNRQIMGRIVLPQALRFAFPPLSNSLIAMVKDTSLAANITVMEMFLATQRIVARTYEPLALYVEVGLAKVPLCRFNLW